MHHELHLLVKHCGFAPTEALRAATYLNAKRFRFHDRGRIEQGLKADFLLVEGNPMQDIDCLLNIQGVWRDGVVCESYEVEL